GGDNVREDRSGLKVESLFAGRRFLHDVGADDVGRHQVGRELNARELQVQDVGNRVHELRLAEAGNALEQHVAAGEQRRQRAIDHLVVADDAAGDLLLDVRELLLEGFNLSVERRRHGSCFLLPRGPWAVKYFLTTSRSDSGTAPSCWADARS